MDTSVNERTARTHASGTGTNVTACKRGQHIGAGDGSHKVGVPSPHTIAPLSSHTNAQRACTAHRKLDIVRARLAMEALRQA